MRFEKIISFVKRVKRFFLVDLWKINLSNKSKFFKLFIVYLRISFISIKGIFKDRIQLRASALSFYTLMSIVPVLTIVFGIAKLVGIETVVNDFVYSIFQGQTDIIDPVLGVVNGILKSAKGEIITIFGSVILLLSAIKLIQNIELSFNDIWYIVEKRTFIKKAKNIFLLLFISPILVFVSSVTSLFLDDTIQMLLTGNKYFDKIFEMASFAISLSHYFLIWLLFSLLFFILPNKKVRFKSAVIAGIISGSLFNLVQWVYITFQVGVTNQSLIYGSFAAIPLFLTWLQMSWLIVLIGAKIAYAIEHEFEIR